MIKAILTDIEGTTSSISFVKDILFPYAEKNLPTFIRANRQKNSVRKELNEVAKISDIPSHNVEALITKLIEWMKADKKTTPLKSLQGMIWKKGYKNADYKAHIYNDAIQKLVEWREKNIKIFVYSSGSIQAQKLFFQYSLYGDARSLFNDYFDTTIGIKKNQDSYKKISQAIGISSGQILFLSDIESELNAAKNVGYDTCWVIRPDDSEVDIETIQSDHQVVSSFHDIKI